MHSHDLTGNVTIFDLQLISIDIAVHISILNNNELRFHSVCLFQFPRKILLLVE